MLLLLTHSEYHAGCVIGLCFRALARTSHADVRRPEASLASPLRRVVYRTHASTAARDTRRRARGLRVLRHHGLDIRVVNQGRFPVQVEQLSQAPPGINRPEVRILLP